VGPSLFAFSFFYRHSFVFQVFSEFEVLKRSGTGEGIRWLARADQSKDYDVRYRVVLARPDFGIHPGACFQRIVNLRENRLNKGDNVFQYNGLPGTL
jgi:hypothetical protein